MLYVSVGSDCNRCNETNPEHATMLRMKPDGSARGIYSSGLRNTIGWGWHPETNEMWGMDHGSDWSGDDLPPEELNWIQSSSHYGWPWCYGRREVDKHFAQNPEGSTKEEMCPRTVAPVLTYQAHSAPLQMAFYNDTAFPPAYRGSAFVAMRGSWNRSSPVGFKVVRVRFQNGKPAGIDDFVTGFLANDGKTHFGRPTGIAVGRDGSLFIGDEINGVIYRVTFKGPDVP
jgi:glucose/arabinose dehydrogenase